MATRTWLGTVDTSWTNANNWSAAVVPTTGDTVIMGSAAVRTLALNVDRTADAAGDGLHLAEFRIAEGFRYDVATAASPLKITCTTFRHESPFCSCYWSNTRGGSGSNSSTRAIVDSGNLGSALTLTGNANLVRLEVRKGGVAITHTSVANQDRIQLIVCGYRTNQMYDSRVTINTGTIFNLVAQYAGTVTVAGGAPDLTDAVQPSIVTYGGICNITTAVQWLGAAPDIILNGGRMQYRGTSTTANQKPWIIAAGGVLDLSLVAGVTVSQLDRWPNCEVRKTASTSAPETVIGV